jgi:hypothetical protein
MSAGRINGNTASPLFLLKVLATVTPAIGYPKQRIDSEVILNNAE